MKKTKKIQHFLTVIIAIFIFSVAANNALAAEPCSSENVRWAHSSNRIYVTGNTTCTLTEIKNLGSQSMPLELIDPTEKIWFLGANLFIQDGAQVVMHGSAMGGDVNELRLKSDSTNFIKILADWGSIDINSTKITSWDENVSGPDTDYFNGRAFIHVRSRLDGDGVTPIESRMDIRNSDVGHLGYPGSEAYGLSWKVLGKDTVGPEIFDNVGVYGDVVNSEIHDNYFGVYTYGAEAMTFINNEVYNNTMYGLDPHDDSDNLLIDGNYVHHNGYHGIIGSQRCNNLTITNNTSNNNGGNGIMLHRNTNYSLVEGNETYNNIDSGIAIFDSHNNQILNNIAKYNKRGIRFSVGSSNNDIENNSFSENNDYGIYFYRGSDIPTSGDGKPKFNTFRNNTANSNGYFAVRVGGADYNIFENNIFANNYKGIYIASDSPTGNTFFANTFSYNGADYNIKLYAAPETSIENNVIEGSKYGILLSNTHNSEIINNNIKFSSKTGVRLQKGSNGNLIINNTIANHVRGLDLIETSSSNIIKENSIINNSSYAVYIYGASNNIFENNNLEGNHLNYYYAKYNSSNTIQNSNSFSLKVAEPLSSMLIKDSINSIFENSKDLSTDVYADTSSIVVDHAEVGKSVVSFNRLNFKSVPSASGVNIKPVIWNTDVNIYRKWITKNTATSLIAVSYTIGDLAPNTAYDVIVNSSVWSTFTSNSSGEINFDYESMPSDEIIFEVL